MHHDRNNIDKNKHRLSLLHLNEKSFEISKEALHSINLDLLFDKSVTSVLAHPCTANEIRARREIFILLETADFHNLFIALADALTAFSQAKSAYENSKSELEGLFALSDTAKKYLLVIQALNEFVKLAKNTEIVCKNVLIASVNEFLSANIGHFENAENYIAIYDELLLNLKNIQLRAANRIIRVFKCNTEKISVNQNLEILLDTVGITASEHACVCEQIRMFSALSDDILKENCEKSEIIKLLGQKLSDCIEYGILSLRPEINFYLLMHIFREKMSKYGIPYCYPHISETPCFVSKNLYDISLVLQDKSEIVPNDTFFQDLKKAFVLTGANGGGKTTYLRACVINLILFLSGCPVFCENASIYPYKKVFLHFPKDEKFDDCGRLDDERIRFDKIASLCDRDTFAFLNEPFSGADEQKGTFLAAEAMNLFYKTNTSALLVTHFHLTSNNGYNFSQLIAVTDKDSGNRRTFRIEKQTSSAENRSFAYDILKKYKLDRFSLEQKVKTLIPESDKKWM